LSASLPLFDQVFSGKPEPPIRLDLEAASRKSDPLSSKRAAREIEKSGVLRGQRLIALNLVKQYPGRSSKELADLGTLDRYQLARRLPELALEKLIKRTEHQAEDCRWWPII
jgi:hypothetical protein